MRSTVLIHGLDGSPEKKEAELNERITEKENEGWEVVEVKSLHRHSDRRR